MNPKTTSNISSYISNILSDHSSDDDDELFNLTSGTGELDEEEFISSDDDEKVTVEEPDSGSDSSDDDLDSDLDSESDSDSKSGDKSNDKSDSTGPEKSSKSPKNSETSSKTTTNKSDTTEDGNDSDDDPIATLKIKKELLQLALEIKMIKKQIPLVDQLNQQKMDQSQAETNFTNKRTEHLELANQKDNAISQVEILSAKAHLPHLEEIINNRQTLELLKTGTSIDEMQDIRTHKRKNLEMDLELGVLESQEPYLRENVSLANQCQKARLINDLAEEAFRTKRISGIEVLQTLQFKRCKRELEEELKDWVDSAPEYLIDPVRRDPITGQNELILSDRVINLNGPICYHTAHYISDRVNYYNNQNQKQPIFLVMNYSPGGSIMSGMQILKTIETSQAPIYVLVEGFVASMAAMIASMAKRSFILPNAQILHHEAWSKPGSMNVTQAREFYDQLMKCYRRLVDPFLAKINISFDKWNEQLYEHNSDGDWEAYGDDAVKMKWVDQVVHTIRKTGKTRHPDWLLKYMTGYAQVPPQADQMIGNIGHMGNLGGQGPHQGPQGHHQGPQGHHQGLQGHLGSQVSLGGQGILPHSPNFIGAVSGISGFATNSAVSLPLNQLAEMNSLIGADQRVLPALRPRDHYLIYNPNNYYTISK